MSQEEYDGHVEALGRGEIVSLGGRTAYDEDELRRVIGYNGDTLPGETEGAPAPTTVSRAEMEGAVNGLQTLVDGLRADNHALQSRVDALTADKADLEGRVNSLKADLAASLQAQQADAGQKAADNTVRAAAEAGLPIAATETAQSKAQSKAPAAPAEKPVDGVLPAGEDKIIGPVAGSLTQAN